LKPPSISDRARLAQAGGGAVQGPLILLSPVEPRFGFSERRGEPVTCGVPLPRGAAATAASLHLLGPDGEEVLSQIAIVDRWPDASIRWALIDFLADAPVGAGPYRLQLGECTRPASAGAVVRITEEHDGFMVQTGRAEFGIGRTGPFPFTRVVVAGAVAIDPTRSALHLSADRRSGLDSRQSTCPVRIIQARVEERGPVRSTILIEAEAGVSPRDPLLLLAARLHFYAGSAVVKCSLTVRNPGRAKHRDGYWDLGDPGSIYIHRLGLTLVTPSGIDPVAELWCSPEPTAPLSRFPGPFDLYQDSSGGERWESTNHLNRFRRKTTSFCGYRMCSDGHEVTGRRATPIALVKRDGLQLALTMQHFWQNFPKAIEGSSDGLTLAIFPDRGPDGHELQGGEQKTHVFAMGFGADSVTETPLEWCRNPLLARVETSWYVESEAVPYLIGDEDADGDYVRLARAAIEGGDTFEMKREVIDEYGWRHFGEIYGDHEAVRHQGPSPLVSHYNNQYDAIGGLIRRFLCSGDVQWWRLADELASHVVDIDIYHTNRDKWAYNHGLFWHTVHYTDADLATHRTYPRAARRGSGGPSAEHNYTTGLMLHYFLTGSRSSREAVESLARFVIDIDDGSKSRYRWLDRGPTGLATSSGSPLYHGPGRGAANSVNALLDGHRITGHEIFLAKAEEIIRRVIHPADDIGARNLLDAERKWFYTMFLQAIGRYLDYKDDRRDRGAMYAYARASLLHYARWMVEHEYPYLDKPEILEFPTETWAAQDSRKSDVFALAARHAAEPDRRHFLERADFFFRYFTSALSRMPTRTLARPVVLMLSNGFVYDWVKRRTLPVASTMTEDAAASGVPGRFVPQKLRAIRRVMVLGFIALAVCAGVIALVLFG
jgi:hypothetical protein